MKFVKHNLASHGNQDFMNILSKMKRTLIIHVITS